MIPASSYKEAITRLLSGGVGVMPTDTVYGLVARAGDKTAVERFYGLKKRERKPGTVIAASVQQLVDLGLQERYLKRVERWWPNPLSVICEAGKELEYLHLGLGSLAVRVTNDEALLQLLEATGPLVSTSANLPGRAGAVNLQEAREYFKDEVDFYVDGADLSGRAPSTIVRIVGDGIEVIRQGAVKIS